MSIDAPKVQDWPAAAVGSMPRAELHGFDDHSRNHSPERIAQLVDAIKQWG